MQAQLDPQSLANTAWAYASLEWKHVPLMDAIAASSLLSIGSWTACELSSSAWAFARCGFRHVPLLAANAAPSDTQLAELTMLDVANTAWAFESLDISIGNRLNKFILVDSFDGFVQNAVVDLKNHGIEMVHLANAFSAA